MKTNWNNLYKSKKFSINTLNPSKVVARVSKELPQHSCIVDFGCGNGRNTLYLASLGHFVTAVDIADLNFLVDIDDKLKSNIEFIKMSVDDFISEKKYEAAIMARLIQYLSEDQLAKLFVRTASLLNKNGLLVINYVANGGLLDKEEYNIQKYKHSPETVKKLLTDSGFSIVDFRRGEKVSKYVPYVVPIEAYELTCKKS